MNQEITGEQPGSTLSQAKISKRLNKRKRSSNPPLIILQDRDREIILAVYRYRYLTREQIEKLFFSTTTRANQRLRKLFQNRYLHRIFIPAAVGSSQAIYALDEKGTWSTAAGLGIDAGNVKRRMNKRVKPLFLEHLLAVNDFHLLLTKACREKQGHELLSWLAENDCKDVFSVWDDKSQCRVEKTFNPDGYGQYRFADRFFSFFLEMDMGTMSNKRFKEKVQRYKLYRESGAYEERYGLRFFRVLVVTSGDRRLENLKRIAEKEKESVWFTTMEKIEADVLGYIWQKTGTEKVYSLVKEEIL